MQTSLQLYWLPLCRAELHDVVAAACVAAATATVESTAYHAAGGPVRTALQARSAAESRCQACAARMMLPAPRSGRHQPAAHAVPCCTLLRRSPPVVGVLGCMAERLKEKLLDSDRLADIVVGPDAYRDLPRLVDLVRGPSSSHDSSSSSSGGSGGGGEGAAGSRRSSPSGPLPGISSSRATTAMNVQLSVEETYADILPVRPAGATSAFLSIMRGCNNMCAFCIVPFTRCAAGPAQCDVM
jgi:hypothetical protein